MLLTHKQKLELTKNIFYPILESMNVFPKKKNKLHTMIIKRLFGKYENLNKLTEIKDEDIDKYRNIAKEYEGDTEFFSDINQITIFEVLNDCAIGLQK